MSSSTVDVSVMLVRALIAALERAGVERTSYIVAAGLEKAPLDNILARISFDDYQRAVGVAYRCARDPAFGLHVGEHLTFGAFDVLGHLTEHSASLRSAIEMCLRYSRIVSDGPRLEFKEYTNTAVLYFVLPENESLAALLAGEFCTVMMLRLLRSFVGDDAVPTRAHFAHAKPAHAAEYTRLFAGRERFSQAFSGLEFDSEWLDREPACRESQLRDYLLNRAEMLLAKAERNVSMTERVKRWLIAQPDLSRPTLEQAAKDLGMSTRSVRRHLQDEKILFSALVDESRATHAVRTLKDTAQSIQETAYALGFRTPSAFSRAFKRWTGKTPRAFRGDAR